MTSDTNCDTDLQNILGRLSEKKARVLELHQGLTARPAVSPQNGGDGEWEKAKWYKEKIQDFGLIDIVNYDAPDERVSAKKRPNFTVTVKGKSERTLWIVAHLDVVPAGSAKLWDDDPFKVFLGKDNDTMCGRGVEDNQQAMVAAALLAAELTEQQITPPLTFGILCISDEETSNEYGIDYLMKNYPDIVKENDLVVVPDFGTEDGKMIEVAEKGVMWTEVAVTGKQCHASTPQEGVNSLVVAAEMIASLPNIQASLCRKDPLFDPDCSTLTPTRILENVPNINTVPGQDVFYIDCRIIPGYTTDEVLDAIKKVFLDIADKHKAQVQLRVVLTEPFAPATDTNSDVMLRMQKAVKTVYGIDTKPGGIGGSTAASRFRIRGIPAVVWARVHPNYHAPNEKGKISYNINDAKVYAHMLYDN